MYQHDRTISADPANFEFLGNDLSRDSVHVYWTEGTVLSSESKNFVVVADEDHHLFAKDGSAVFVNGNVIAGASPSTFQVMQGAYSRDDTDGFYFDARVYWMGRPVDGADPATFPPGRAVTGCSETTIVFGE